MAAELDVDEAILDGEVIAADATGRPQFYELLRRARAPSYVAFDLLWLDATCALCLSASAGSAC
jgi:ATP-dependent DNA ligase